MTPGKHGETGASTRNHTDIGTNSTRSSRAFWPPVRDAELLALRAAHLSRSQIAARMELSSGQIDHRLFLLRSPDPPRPVGPQTSPIPPDAELVRQLQPFAKGPWPVDRLLALCHGWRDGETASHIGARLGSGKNAVCGKVHRLTTAGILQARGQSGGGWTTGRRRLGGAEELAHAHAVTKRLTPLALNRPLTSVPPSSIAAPIAPEIITGPVTLSSLASIASAPSPAASPAKGGAVTNATVAPLPLAPLRSEVRGYSHAQRTIAGTATAHATRAPTLPNSQPLAAAAPPPLAPRPYGRVTECSWPIGEVGTRAFHFCDQPSDPGRPYCPDHCQRAYVKVPRGHPSPWAGTGALLGSER